MYNPINTENLDYTGINALKRRIAQIRKLDEKRKN